MRLALLLLLAISLALSGCAAGGGRANRVNAALLSDRPPEDFWLAVTVLRPVPLGLVIGARTGPTRPVAERPARYVVEADMMLRAATGYGASEQTFPPRTRQLDADQWASLWEALRRSSLVDPGHPAITGRAPTLDEADELARGRAAYVVSFAIEGERRTLVLAEDDPGAADARQLVERLALLAWIDR